MFCPSESFFSDCFDTFAGSFYTDIHHIMICHKLDQFTEKHSRFPTELFDGFAIVSSEKVNDYALIEAAYLIRQVLQNRSDILEKLAEKKVRFVKDYWIVKKRLFK